MRIEEPSCFIQAGIEVEGAGGCCDFQTAAHSIFCELFPPFNRAADCIGHPGGRRSGHDGSQIGRRTPFTAGTLDHPGACL